jgi:hypothetical protein
VLPQVLRRHTCAILDKASDECSVETFQRKGAGRSVTGRELEARRQNSGSSAGCAKPSGMTAGRPAIGGGQRTREALVEMPIMLQVQCGQAGVKEHKKEENVYCRQCRSRGKSRGARGRFLRNAVCDVNLRK